MPKISIIVPCYKQAQYLDECLQSVLEQTYENWECLIINDGSPDNTEKVAQQWIAKDSRFKYFYKENGGLSSARNYGIQKAEGDYLFFLDSDDKIANADVFYNFYNYFKDKQYDFIVGDVIERFENNSLRISELNSKVASLTELKKNEVLKSFIQHTFSVISCSKFYRKNFLNSNGIFFKEKILHEDELFMFHISAAAESVLLVPIICYEYNRVNISSITSNITLQNKADKIIIINEHYEIIKKYDLINRVGIFLLNDRVKYLGNLILFGQLLLSQKEVWKAYFKQLKNDYQNNGVIGLNGCYPYNSEISFQMMKFKFWAHYKSQSLIIKKINSYIRVI